MQPNEYFVPTGGPKCRQPLKASALPVKARGFTLVEVLVALGIIALVMPALLLVIRERADSVTHLRDQTLAQWVAANRIAEIRLRGLDALERDGTEVMGGRSWHWRFGTTETGVDGFVRVDVEVTPEDEFGSEREPDPGVTLTGFVRDDATVSARRQLQ